MPSGRHGSLLSLSDVEANSDDYPFAIENLKVRCSELTDKIFGILSYDSVLCPQETHISSFRNKATVGILLVDTKLSDMAFGGPAYNSGLLKKGDRIICVDGTPVSTAEEIGNALLKNDLPGATVALTIERDDSENAPQQLETVLTKVDASLIADRCQVFEAFASLKVWLETTNCFSNLPNTFNQEHMMQENSTRAVEMLASFMDMITHMIKASHDQSERMAAAINTLVLEGGAVVQELRRVLDVTFGLFQGTLETRQPLAGSRSGGSSTACSSRHRSDDYSDESATDTSDDLETAPLQRPEQQRGAMLYHLKGRNPLVPRLMLEGITAAQTRPLPSQSPVPVSFDAGPACPSAPAVAASSRLVSDALSKAILAGSCMGLFESSSGPSQTCPNPDAWEGLVRRADQSHRTDTAAFECAASNRDEIQLEEKQMGLEYPGLFVVPTDFQCDSAPERFARLTMENMALKMQIEQLQRELAHAMSLNPFHLSRACEMKAVIGGVSIQLQFESENLHQELESLRECLDSSVHGMCLSGVKTTEAGDKWENWKAVFVQGDLEKEILRGESQGTESTQVSHELARSGAQKQNDSRHESHQTSLGPADENYASSNELCYSASVCMKVNDHTERKRWLNVDAGMECTDCELSGWTDSQDACKVHGAFHESWECAIKEAELHVNSSQATLDYLQLLLTNTAMGLHPTALRVTNLTKDLPDLVASGRIEAKTNVPLAGDETVANNYIMPMPLEMYWESKLQHCNDYENQNELSVNHNVHDQIKCTNPNLNTGPRTRNCEKHLLASMERSDQNFFEGIVLTSNLADLMSIEKIKETEFLLGIQHIQSSLAEVNLLLGQLDHVEQEMDKAVTTTAVISVENEQLRKWANDLIVAGVLETGEGAVGSSNSKNEALKSPNLPIPCTGIEIIQDNEELHSSTAQIMVFTDTGVPRQDGMGGADPSCADKGKEVIYQEGYPCVWHARWDDALEDVMRQAITNEEIIELLKSRVGDMLFDMYIAAVEMERVEASISGILIPTNMIQNLKDEIETKETQLHHLTMQYQDGQETIQRLLEKLGNLMSKDELNECIAQNGSNQVELEYVLQEGYPAILPCAGWEVQSLESEVVQSLHESEICSEAVSTSELSTKEGINVAAEKERENSENSVTQELWEAEMNAVESLVHASQDAVMDLKCCICDLVPRKCLLAAEKRSTRVEEMLSSEVLKLQSDVHSKDSQLHNMTIQAAASCALVAGLQTQLETIVPKDVLGKILRDFDLLLDEVGHLQVNAGNLVSIEGLASVEKMLCEKTSEIESLHTSIQNRLKQEELICAKEHMLMLTETVTVLKRQLLEKAAEVSELEMLLAAKSKDSQALSSSTSNKNICSSGDVERMRTVIAEASALAPSLELCLADVTWLLQQAADSVIHVNPNDLSEQVLEPYSAPRLETMELVGSAETNQCALSWKWNIFAFLLAGILFLCYGLDTPVTVVV